jgi:putative proteasome-type protease
MTYCVGLVLNGGLVMAADSRTNAGVDYVTTFSKLHVFNPAPERIFVLLSAGNLATTQEVLNRIRRDLDQPPEGPHLLNVNYLFEAADYVGKVSLAVQREHGPALSQSGVSAETTLILGGQIGGESHGLFLVYPQGNYFSASAETPYLQIGESKYGKPALDRIAKPEMSLDDGARLCLVSLDATSRSNVTVGPPFEVVIYPRDTMQINQRLKLDADDPMLKQISQSWNLGLRSAFDGLPRFEWEGPNPTSPELTS